MDVYFYKGFVILEPNDVENKRYPNNRINLEKLNVGSLAK